MKKLLASVFSVCFLLCAGCSLNTPMPRVSNISFNFSFQNGQEPFKVDARIGESGEMSFIVREPESIKDFTMVFSGDTVKTEFLGVQNSFPITDTDFGIFNKIYAAFSGLEGSQIKAQDGMYIATVSSDGDEEYVFTLTDLGLPISLKIGNTMIEFADIQTK